MAINTALIALRWDLNTAPIRRQERITDIVTGREPDNEDTFYGRELFDFASVIANLSTPDTTRGPIVVREPPTRTRSFVVRPWPTAWYDGPHTLILVYIPSEAKLYDLTEIQPIHPREWRIDLSERHEEPNRRSVRLSVPAPGDEDTGFVVV